MDSYTIVDKVVNYALLVSRRFSKGITTNIVFFTQLVNEGWKMKSNESGNQHFFHTLNNETRLIFIENKNSLYCLRAKIADKICM